MINKIKSQATTLTVSNIERLIVEGNDLWIIQVYEDADDFCEHIADKWEAIIKVIYYLFFIAKFLFISIIFLFEY